MSTLRKLFEQNEKRLGLTWVVHTQRETEDVELFGTDHTLHTPSADLVGYLNLIHPGRIQILARNEIDYFEALDDHRREAICNQLARVKPPALFLTCGIVPSEHLLELCKTSDIPLLTSPHDAAHVIDILRLYLSREMAQRTTMHGVLVDVLGLGVLITGESGLGKSELALELISRGHGLVADDVVELARVAPTIIEGRCPSLITNLLEVRGLGLLDIQAIFGETAVRRKMRLKLIVHLVKRSTMDSDYQRLPLDTLTQEVLGLPIQKVVIPVDLGRNIAVLLEAAVRNTILQLRGIHTLNRFMERQAAEMNEDGTKKNWDI